MKKRNNVDCGFGTAICKSLQNFKFLGVEGSNHSIIKAGKIFSFITLNFFFKVLKKHRISHQKYEMITARVMKAGSNFELEVGIFFMFFLNT